MQKTLLLFQCQFQSTRVVSSYHLPPHHQNHHSPGNGDSSPVESQDQSFSLNHNLNFSLKSHVYGDHHPDIAFDGNLCHDDDENLHDRDFRHAYHIVEAVQAEKSPMTQHHNLQAAFGLPILSELIFHNLLCVLDVKDTEDTLI